MALEVDDDMAASADRLPDQHQLQAAKQRYLHRFVIQVQEKLLADGVSQLDLRKAARVLRPCDYDAVVEERQHSKRCGLPTCPNHLAPEPADPDSVPKYRIRRAQCQVVQARAPPARRPYCSGVCAARSATYRSALSDVHLQFRDLVPSTGSGAGAAGPGPVRARVTEKTLSSSLPPVDSFADMLFELSRIARSQLEGVPVSEAASADAADPGPADLLIPEPTRLGASARLAALSPFGHLLVRVGGWRRPAHGAVIADAAVQAQVGARLRRCCPEWHLAVVEADLDRWLSSLAIASDDDLPETDDEWIVVSVAMIQSLLRAPSLPELCLEGCQHRRCLIALLQSTPYGVHHVDSLAHCLYLDRAR